ncbi:GAF domain-containing protein [Lysinimonas soli]|uniref:GAF domain-containing protein n=1 Tax=Lysinimonas soli TaxID=1074233 RepID=A0ABW0NPX7_9MICO
MTAAARLAYRLRRPLLAALTDASIERHGVLPHPPASSHVHAMGSNPYRILLLGTAAASSIGVASHEVGLGGQLARRMAAITGHGVDLDVRARQTLSVTEATALLRGLDLYRYDAVILMLGAREASGWQPRSLWSRELGELLATVSRSASCATQTFVVPIVNLPDFIDYPGVLARRVTHQVGQLNAVSEQICLSRARTTFVPFSPPPAPGGFTTTPITMFERWADGLAPAIAAGLMLAGERPHPANGVDEQDRQRALDELGIVGSPADDRYERIVRMARSAFGVRGAAINFIDHGRQWTKAAVPMRFDDIDRMNAFCNSTIERAELLVVEDATTDPEFAELPWVTGPAQLRFYAGYPLEAPDGHRVGAICIVDPNPRAFSKTDASILRELALRAQELLWEGARVSAGEGKGQSR